MKLSLNGEIITLTSESILKARQAFADLIDRSNMNAIIDGKDSEAIEVFVKLNNQLKSKYLAGKFDDTLLFIKEALFQQFGTRNQTFSIIKD